MFEKHAVWTRVKRKESKNAPGSEYGVNTPVRGWRATPVVKYLTRVGSSRRLGWLIRLSASAKRLPLEGFAAQYPPGMSQQASSIKLWVH